MQTPSPDSSAELRPAQAPRSGVDRGSGPSSSTVIPSAEGAGAHTVRNHVGAVWFAQVLVILLLLLIGEGIVRAGVINPLFASPPSAVAQAVYHGLVDGELSGLTLVTLYEVVVSLAIASAAGIALGYSLWRFDLLGRAYDPLLAALFSSPIILLYPIFLVLFGRTYQAIIAQGALYGALPMIIYTRQALGGVAPSLLRVAAVHRLSGGQRFRKVLLPAAAPAIFLGVRLAMTYILISIIAMEYLVKIGGIGKYIANADLAFQIVDVYAGVAMVVVMTVVLTSLTYAFQWLATR